MCYKIIVRKNYSPSSFLKRHLLSVISTYLPLKQDVLQASTFNDTDNNLSYLTPSLSPPNLQLNRLSSPFKIGCYVSRLSSLGHPNSTCDFDSIHIILSNALTLVLRLLWSILIGWLSKSIMNNLMICSFNVSRLIWSILMDKLARTLKAATGISRSKELLIILPLLLLVIVQINRWARCCWAGQLYCWEGQFSCWKGWLDWNFDDVGLRCLTKIT